MFYSLLFFILVILTEAANQEQIVLLKNQNNLNTLKNANNGGMLNNNSVLLSTSSYQSNDAQDGTYDGTVEQCAGTILKLEKSSYYSSEHEGFSLIDLTDNSVLFHQAVGSSSTSETIESYSFCVSHAAYEVRAESDIDYWIGYSELRIFLQYTQEDREYVNRIHYENRLNVNPSVIVHPLYTIKANQQWYYKMNSVPTSWYDDSVTNWSQASSGSFPAATNQIQLYKKQFSITDLVSITSLIVLLRHSRGHLIYINGYELSRMFIEGELTSSSISVGSYVGVVYRTISLPARSTGLQVPINYLKEGQNTIAIAIIGSSPAQKSSTFDCALRVTRTPTVIRTNQVSVTTTGFVGDKNALFQDYLSEPFSYSQCNDANSITITFNEDRREWVTAISITNSIESQIQSPHTITIEARNTNTESWTSLIVVDNMKWWIKAQEKIIRFNNNKAYNTYRLSKMQIHHLTQCIFTLSRIVMYQENGFEEIPALAYPQNNAAYKSIEMAEIVPNSDRYNQFSITPKLPEGLEIDSVSGVVKGTPKELSSQTTYTITAHTITGTTVTATMTLEVIICTGGKTLMTMVLRTPYSVSDISYKVFTGYDTTGVPIITVPSLLYKYTMYYADWCLDFDIYTVVIEDKSGEEWTAPAGMMLTLDKGAIRYEAKRSDRINGKIKLQNSFSSYVPAQMGFSTWKMNTNVDTNWKNRDYDDSTWQDVKPYETVTAEEVTTYWRMQFDIPSLENYHLLNVAVKYSGGLVAYFNGVQIARFNLPEDFISQTGGTFIHKTDLVSLFHVILTSSNAYTSKNSLAIEVHRAIESLPSHPVDFDATIFFGVDDCSMIVDSMTVSSASMNSGLLSSLIDRDPTSYIELKNEKFSSFAVDIENLEGSSFNQFGVLMFSTTVNSLDFSISAKTKESLWISLIEKSDQTWLQNQRVLYPVTLGLLPFSSIKYEQNNKASTSVILSSLLFHYCIPKGSICNEQDGFPAVKEGEISPKLCPEGFTGYSYRLCKNGQFETINTDNCLYKEPKDLQYGSSILVFIKDIETVEAKPTAVNIITNYELQEGTALPEGLVLDAKTGIISGKPKKVADIVTYTIIGKNPSGSVKTVVSLSVRQAYCNTDNEFERTVVGSVFEYECSKGGSYVGTVRRACNLGVNDGEWGNSTGACYSIGLMVGWILTGIIVIAIVILIVMRVTRKNKKGGLKKKTLERKREVVEKSKVKRTKV